MGSGLGAFVRTCELQAGWLRGGARLSLAILGTSAVVLALGSAFSPAVPENIQALDTAGGPFAGLLPRLSEAAFAALLAVMLASYAATLALVRQLSLGSVVAVIVALHAVFLLGPLLLNTDVFLYLVHARNGVLNGLNPYLDVAATVPNDPAVPYVGKAWLDRPTLYGPLFTVLTYGAAPLGLAGGLWAIKLVTALASLASVGLVALSARALGRSQIAATAFVGLNPLLLVVIVGGAHNDAFLGLLFAGALYLLVVDRPRWSGAAAAAAGAIKAPAFLVLPFVVFGARRQRDVLIGALIAAFLMAGLTLLVFGPRGAVGMVDSLVSYSGADRLSQQSLPGQALRAFGLLHLETVARTVGTVLVAVIVVFLLARTWRGADWITSSGWAVLALLVLSGLVHPWYLAWLLPLAALARGESLRPATVALTACFVIAIPQSQSLGESTIELLLGPFGR